MSISLTVHSEPNLNGISAPLARYDNQKSSQKRHPHKLPKTCLVVNNSFQLLFFKVTARLTTIRKCTYKPYS